MKINKVYIFIILGSIIISLYLFEAYLRYTKKNNFTNLYTNRSYKIKVYQNETGKNFDERTIVQFYKDLKKENKNIVLPFLPHNLRGKSDVDLFPLAGPSNSKTIVCNENGYYSIIQSDRFGFNNPDEEWNNNEIEYILFGDSFTYGDCVNRPYDIASVLRSLSNKSVLNLGYRGNGPLMEFATFKEYFPKYKKVKKILWLYYEGNDNYELTLELKNDILKKYLNNLNYSQNLREKQEYIDLKVKLSNQDIEKKIIQSKNKLKTSKNKNHNNQIIKFLKLKEIRSNLKKNPLPRNQLKKILYYINEFAENKNSEFYFIYLPEYSRYKSRNYSQRNYKKIKKILNKLEIPFIDIHKEVFENENNPLKLFPFELSGHYNKEGYKKTAEYIYKYTIN